MLREGKGIPKAISSVSVNTEKAYSGGYGPGVPPLPIPNREVKPGRADGTAPQCGRVGRRLLEREFHAKMRGTPFFVLISLY